MKKKTKTPLALRILPAVFPWLERLMPPVANRFFAYLFFTPINYGVPEKERKSETFAEKFQITYNGKRIQGYQWGKAEKTILVMHGWAGRATQFRRFVKPLQKAGYQVIGVDAPAHGKSQGNRTHIIEFMEVIKILNARFKNIDAIVGHSLGGVAALFAIAEGLPVKTLINIASPTISEEIINTYLKALGGSHKTGIAFRKFVLKKYGKPFEDFSSLTFIKRVPANLKLLLIHDEDDIEVSMQHPLELIKIFPQAQLYKTSGLGHTRILRDNDVIGQTVTFIEAESSKP